MPSYEKGQVVDAYWPNDDPNNKGYKDRPCVVLEVLSNDYYKLCSVTGTDRSSHCKGVVIEKSNPNYKSMRLTKKSFINLSDSKIVHKRIIRNYRGKCDCINVLDNIIK